MTEKEIKELVQLIKDNELYCTIELEADDTELSEDGMSYSSVVVHVCDDRHRSRDIIKLQIILDEDSETYFLDNTSYEYGEETIRKANAVNKYCKGLIKKHM